MALHFQKCLGLGQLLCYAIGKKEPRRGQQYHVTSFRIKKIGRLAKHYVDLDCTQIMLNFQQTLCWKGAQGFSWSTVLNCGMRLWVGNTSDYSPLEILSYWQVWLHRYEGDTRGQLASKKTIKCSYKKLSGTIALVKKLSIQSIKAQPWLAIENIFISVVLYINTSLKKRKNDNLHSW